ncbi:hypothetical protein SAMN03159382_00955 [Pseudomonas sp. NFACC23-1]|nr:hypothetical protein SAMN03159386_00648 [Pseudomonas sp. NFACC17-2]SEJ04090.1 hypothetical protein SAMN03159382_00955 [Pseudomonas sp. NFACC23-1]SFW38052.1 hypothetical protein SAMN05660640_01131 [Pseudomonas sp. NFACC16-2]
MIADGIVAAAQGQLVSQAQGAVPVQGSAPLLLAGAFLPVVMPGQASAPRLLRGVIDPHFAAADVLPRRQFHLYTVGRQTVQLIDHLLHLTQVEQFAGFAGKSHRQLAIRQPTVLGTFQAFQAPLDDQHLQVTAGQVLLRQVGATGDQAFVEIMVSNDFEQLVQLRHAQALADVRLEQVFALRIGQSIGALELDGLDREATGIDRGRRLSRLRLLAGQVLEFFQAPTLLFEQAILTFTDQVRVTGGWRSVSKR